jgi:hypothetical protein
VSALTGVCRSIFFRNTSAENKFAFGAKDGKAGQSESKQVKGTAKGRQRDGKGLLDFYSNFAIKLNGLCDLFKVGEPHAPSLPFFARSLPALCPPFAFLCHLLCSPLTLFGGNLFFARNTKEKLIADSDRRYVPDERTQ